MAVQQRKKEKGMRLRYKNWKTNIMKKGEELSTLCDVKVCVIVVSPDGKLETWPENLNDVKAVLSAIKGSSKPVRSEHNPKKKKGHKDLPKPITVNDVADVKGKDICIGNADQENNVEDEDITMINNPNSFCHNPTIGEMHESLEDHGVSIWSAEMGVPDMVVNECPTMSMVVNHQELSSNYENQQEIGGSSAMNSNFTYHAYEIGSSSCISSGVTSPNELCTLPLFDESLGVDIWSGGMGVPNMAAVNEFAAMNMVVNPEEPSSLGVMPLLDESLGVNIWSSGMDVPNVVVNECPAMNMLVNHQVPSSNYGNQQEFGGSSAMNSNFTYHAYEIGSSSYINSGVTCPNELGTMPLFDESLGVDIWSGGMGVPNNMVLNQEVPLSNVSLGVDIWSDVLDQQPSAMNSSFAHYDQFEIGSSSGYTYEIGSCSYINSGVAHPNQPPFF